MTATLPMRLCLVCSDQPDDLDLLDELAGNLRMLPGAVVWGPRQVLPGSDVLADLRSEVAAADVVIPLVSVELLNGPRWAEVRAGARPGALLPVRLRAHDEAHSDLAGKQLLPRGGQAIA